MLAYPVTRNMMLRVAAKISLMKINIRTTMVNVNRNLKNPTTNCVTVNNYTLHFSFWSGWFRGSYALGKRMTSRGEIRGENVRSISEKNSASRDPSGVHCKLHYKKNNISCQE